MSDLEAYISECVTRGDAPIKREFIKHIERVNFNEKHCSESEKINKDSKLSETTDNLSNNAKRHRGQNKVHERAANSAALSQSKADQLCFKFASAASCELGTNCNFSHDLKNYLTTRLPDLGSVCPNIEKFGVCSYGLNCRFGLSHTNEEGVNVNSVGEVVNSSMLAHMHDNFVAFGTRIQLRKREYNFGRALAVTNAYRPEKNGPNLNDENMVSIRERLQNEENSDNSKTIFKKNINETLRKINEESLLGAGCVVESWNEEKNNRRSAYNIRDKVVLAPLTTVGNLPFRRICVDYGVDGTFSEMALATSILEGKPSELALLKKHPSEKLFGVQIAGGYADTMTKTAQFIDEHIECNFVDINSGCPLEGLHNKGAGCMLMTKPINMEHMVRSMSSVLRSPLTVKIRMAFMEKERCAKSYMARLEEWGASAVTLHGRTAKQRYTKLADWDYIGSCKSELRRIPLIGDGDVMSWQECEEKFRLGLSDAVMIGRGALIKPWVFSEIKEKRDWDISSSERFDMLKKFAAYGMEHWGSDSKGIETTRRFILEALSFLHRYIPVGLLEVVPQRIHWRPPPIVGRDEMETRLASPAVSDWMWIVDKLLGPPPSQFTFIPKHKSNSYAAAVDANDLARSATAEGRAEVVEAAELAAKCIENNESIERED